MDKKNQHKITRIGAINSLLLALIFFSVAPVWADRPFPQQKGPVNDFAKVRALPNNFFLILIGADAASGTEFWLRSNESSNRCWQENGMASIWGKVLNSVKLVDEAVTRSLISKGSHAFFEKCQQRNIYINVVLAPEEHISPTQYGNLIIKPPSVYGRVFQGAIIFYKNQVLEEEQEKRQGFGLRAEVGGSRTGTLVKWKFACTRFEFEGAVQVHGDVSPSVDLTDDQIARQLLHEGGRVYQRSCHPSAELKGVWVRLFRNHQEASGVVTENGFSSYYNPMADEARRSRSIKSFIPKFKVEVWFNSNEMGRLTSNPFQWKGKVIAFEAEFGYMLSEDSGVFDLPSNGFFIAVKKLPSARFTRTGERFLLAGRVQGMSRVQMPLLGNTSVPELSFIGAEPAPSPMSR